MKKKVSRCVLVAREHCGNARTARDSRADNGYRNYAYIEKIREWLRDGAHPFPGQLVRETEIKRTARLRVNEVECYGIVKALKFERMRQIEKALEAERRVRYGGQKIGVENRGTGDGSVLFAGRKELGK